MSGQYCQGCGLQLAPGSTFCSNCGKSQNGSVGQSSQSNYSTPNYSAPSYQTPTPQVNYYNSMPGNSQMSYRDAPLSVGQYILAFILMSIPLVGFIMMLIWAFSSDTNTNKKNFSRAVLLMGVIVGLIYGIIMVIVLIIASISSGMGGF